MKKSTVLLVGLVFFVFALARAAEQDNAKKAEFVVGLVDNVQWSDSGKSGSGDEVVIYVVGDSPVTAKIQELAGIRSAQGQRIRVETVSDSHDLSRGHIVFLPSDDMALLAKVLKKVGTSKTVTVADAENFARYGAMISIFNEDGSSDIRYQINRLVAESSGIKFSAELMEKAVLI